jgi:hypothetical protein
MGVRIYASTEIRKGGSMSKAPDLSAFPIPRKGGARPIMDDAIEGAGRGAGEAAVPESAPPIQPLEDIAAPEATTTPQPASATKGAPGAGRLARSIQPPRASTAPPPTYGQIVATTVKLDENRYLRLMEAGKPGPGRLRRRTIQDMLIEALDEWFERRQL